MSRFGKRLTVLVSSLTLLASLPFVGPAASVLAVGDVTINAATTFGAADASDGTADGVFTVTGNLTITSAGSITCNDTGSSGSGACPISIKVTGDMLMEAGSSIKAENTVNGGSGGAITIDVDGDLTMDGTNNGDAGAVISSRKTAGAGDTGAGGNIWITVGDPSIASGSFFMGGGSATYGAETGARIDATGPGASGDITILVGRDYFTEPGSVIASGGYGGSAIQQGGKINLVATCELTTQGRVTSKGTDPGADLVHIEGCDVLIQGLVESTGKGHTVSGNPAAIGPPFNSCDGNNDLLPGEVIHTDKPTNATGCIEVWGGNITIDSTGGWAGELNADVGNGGNEGMSWIDVYAFSSLVVADGTGNDRNSNNLGHIYFSTFAVHANQINGSDHTPGVVTAKVANGALTANTVDGHTFQASTTGNGSDGGSVTLEALGNVNLNDAFVNAAGDIDDSPNVNGGQIAVRSWTGNASWTSGDGDARPATASIAVVAHLVADTTGTDFHGIAAVTTSGAPAGAPTIPFYVVFNVNGWALCQFAPPDLGSLLILKRDGEAQPLAGAEFTVEGFGATFTTDADGIFCLDNLVIGDTLTVTETKAPPGFDKANPASQNVLVDSLEDCETRLAGDWTADATFVNTPKQQEELGSVVVYKKDADTLAKVPGAVFTIATEGGTPQNMPEVADGVFCIDGLSLDDGDYKVTEITPPPGYKPALPNFQWVTADAGSTCEDPGRLDNAHVDLKFHNKPSDEPPPEELGSVVVYKKDADTLAKVPGAVFTIATEGGTPQNMPEVADGVFCVDGLSLDKGDYKVTEITPPPGYKPALPNFQWVTADAGSTCEDPGRLDNAHVDLKFHNKPSDQVAGGLEVLKQDQALTPLPGAEFKLWLDDGNGVFDPTGGAGGGGGGCSGGANVTPVASNATGAATLAAAMVVDPATLSGASFQTVPEAGTPNGTAGCLSWFATNGNSFGILTSGDVNLADDANNAPDDGADLGGGNIRGDSDQDVTVLKIDLATPAGANCLRFDFAFYSEEYAEFVGSSFNDAFVAELNSSTWTTGTSSITAPNNFAFDPTDASHQVISINNTGPTAMSTANAAGTTYDGGTVLMSAATPITLATNSLYLSMFDQGDGVLDSAVFLDNIRFQTVAAGECVPGATNAAQDTLIDTKITGADGLALFTGLEPGTYWLQESVPPQGCTANVAVTKVELTAEQLGSGIPVRVVVDNTCPEQVEQVDQGVQAGAPTPAAGGVPNTAAGLIATGWLPMLMALVLLGSLGALATVNVQSVRRRRRR